MRHALRDYQRRAVAEVVANLDTRPILVAPTGSGKTVMGVSVVEAVARPTLWLAHRKELVEQAAGRLEAHGLGVGVVMAGVEPKPSAPVQVASVQTLARRQVPASGLIVIDECHHATADGYGAVFERLPGVPRVGLTATPFRLDGRGLGDVFGRLVVAATVRELVEAGTLHLPKVWASSAPDLRGVRMVGGDYNLGALAARANTDTLVGDIVETWIVRAAGKKTVCFAINVEHSKAIVEAFKARNIAAEHLDGSTPKDERAAILSRLRGGFTSIVSNCMVLTEGWDLPSLECAIVARPTASLNLHLQMIGRIMRAAPGKAGAIVLDHAGNHHMHGLVTRALDYSLDGERVGHSEPLGLRRCPECGLMYDIAEAACPGCWWRPAPADPREPASVHAAGELVEFDDASFDYRRSVWNIIEAEREAKDYAEGWATFRYKERFGVYPILAGRELIDPHNATLDQKRQIYAGFVEVARAKNFAPGWASHRYRQIFGVWPKGFVKDMHRADVRGRWEARLRA